MEDIDAKFSGFSQARICYYALVLCDVCGRMLNGLDPPRGGVGGGRARIRVESEDDEIVAAQLYHDRHTSDACLTAVVGAYREHGAACSGACSMAFEQREEMLDQQDREDAEEEVEAVRRKRRRMVL